MRKVFRVLRALLRGLWQAVSFGRRLAANLLFLAAVALLAVLFFVGREPRLPESAVLVVAPSGVLVEEATRELSLTEFLSEEEGAAETVVRDVVEALDLAREDPRIRAVLLDPSRLSGAALSKLQALGAALERFRGSGKPVIAAADYFLQSSYYLAAHADRVYVGPMGGVFLKGFGLYRHYWRSALDRLGVKVHVFRAGAYKSAAEPLERTEMSDEDRTASAALLDVLWSEYKQGVAARRGLDPARLEDYVQEFPRHLEAAGGDAAQAALAAGLVDAVRGREALREELTALVGEDVAEQSFRRIESGKYLRARRAELGRPDDRRPKIAVIVAQGVLLDGVARPGRVGSAQLARRIRKAVQDGSVRALVLRVDSPGGSALTAENVLRELERARLAGKPVVASFGSTAASGGYWIACGADEIWAAPTTVTGSIGVFGVLPTFEKGLESLGIRNDGVGTTRVADAFVPGRPLNPLVASSMSLLVERSYQAFLERVGQARGLSGERLRLAAEGRVWSGRDAREKGLVDHLGGIEEAIAAAARRAKLEDYAVDYVEPPLSRREKILREIQEQWVQGGGDWRRLARLVFPAEAVWALPQGIGELLTQDPRGVFAYCLACEGID
ncbi:MAG: signal peptide peptidase SppA [Desulfobacterales bacterium]